MNNYKQVRNITAGTLTIRNIAQDTDGIGALTLILQPGQTVDLSTLYAADETAACVGLESAVAASQLEVLSTYGDVPAQIAALEAAVADLTSRVEALEA